MGHACDDGFAVHLRGWGQYPGEKEITFPPYTCLEADGDPRVEWTKEGEIVVFPLKVSDVPISPPHPVITRLTHFRWKSRPALQHPSLQTTFATSGAAVSFFSMALIFLQRRAHVPATGHTNNLLCAHYV
jgi:hypothetical protein